MFGQQDWVGQVRNGPDHARPRYSVPARAPTLASLTTHARNLCTADACVCFSAAHPWPCLVRRRRPMCP